MKIELKSIHHSIQLSEETEAFTANLYINGVHAGYAKNEGHGGDTHYQAKDEKGRELIRQAEEHCKILPPIEYPPDNYMEAFSIDMNLEHYIDDLLNKYLEKKETAKFNAKLDNSMLKGIVYGVPNQSFGAISFNLPLGQVLAHPKGPQTVVQTITDKILPKLTDGNKLLNTNIPESITKAAGLKEEQYVKPTIQNIRYGTIPDIDENKNNRGRSR
ncbi:hypothetical protein [Sphingobacterium hotanense]|uniref:hypothetical protein n=1 Tax=Sphingobacterium hotanense TaxID=649196 RepID=UPI0021A67293|nr:hypothetical protein [Sphingobacterium hotanense]MCT1525657.1 hypothetical protein [Sphingobacterium hotanense]